MHAPSPPPTRRPLLARSAPTTTQGCVAGPKREKLRAQHSLEEAPCGDCERISGCPINQATVMGGRAAGGVAGAAAHASPAAFAVAVAAC